MIAVYQACLNILTKLTIFLGKKFKKIPEPLVKALKVTQDEYDMEKVDKVSSSVEGQKQGYVCVTPH